MTTDTFACFLHCFILVLFWSLQQRRTPKRHNIPFKSKNSPFNQRSVEMILEFWPLVYLLFVCCFVENLVFSCLYIFVTWEKTRFLRLLCFPTKIQSGGHSHVSRSHVILSFSNDPTTSRGKIWLKNSNSPDWLTFTVSNFPRRNDPMLSINVVQRQLQPYLTLWADTISFCRYYPNFHFYLFKGSEKEIVHIHAKGFQTFESNKGEFHIGQIKLQPPST